MKSSLRLRYNYWLLLLLGILFLLQLIAFAIYEVFEWREWGTMEHVKEDLLELAVLLAIDLTVLPFILMVSWAISGRMLSPLHSVAATSRRIAAGNLGERVTSPVADDEIESVVQAINGAFDKYQDALQRLQRFTSDASHQLRTPLAAMRSMGEVALQKERSPAEYRDTVGAMLEEVDRLAVIVEKLLLLARLERARVQEKFQRLDLAPVVAAVADSFNILAQDRGLTMELMTEGGLRVQGDDGLLHQAVANLVDNAIRYTPRGGAVRLRLFRQNGRVKLVVADTGPGVPAEYRARLFERFSRGPGAAGGGSGLGLAIVADIVRIHGGMVTMKDAAGGGAEFHVELPEAPATEQA